MLISVFIFWSFLNNFYTKELEKISSNDILFNETAKQSKNSKEKLIAKEENHQEDFIGEVNYQQQDNFQGTTQTSGPLESIKSKVVSVIKNNAAKESWKERCTVFKYLYPLCMIMILNFTVTLCIFPKLIFDDDLKPIGKEGGYNVGVLLYNVGDLIGRFCYRYVNLKDNIFVLVYCVSRAIFFPMFYIFIEVNIIKSGTILHSWWINYIVS